MFPSNILPVCIMTVIILGTVVVLLIIAGMDKAQ